MPKTSQTEKPNFLGNPDAFVSEAQVREDMSKMGCLVTNPYRSSHDLKNEADQRLDVARELLITAGALPGEGVQVEDMQAACCAAAMLIGDSVALMDSAFHPDDKEG